MAYYFQCPNCHSDAHFSVPKEDTGNLGCLLFLLAGWWAWLIYAGGRSGRVQCGSCGFIFQQPAIPRTGVSSLAIGTVAILVCAVAVSWAMITMEIEPSPAIQLSGMESVIARNPRVMLYVWSVALLLITVSAIVASWVSNIRFRRQFSKQYQIEPTSSYQPIASPPDVPPAKTKP